MKQTLLFAGILLTFFNLTTFGQDKKVAVVTFYITRQVDMSDFGAEAQNLSIALAKEPNFNLQPLLQEFHSRFFDEYSKAFPFQLLPEDQVLNNDAYKAYTPVGTTSDNTFYNVPYAGYKIVVPMLGHENERNLLKIFDQADGVMKVFIDFTLYKYAFNNMGVVKMNVHANIALFNKDGEKVFSIKEDARSKKTSPLVGGFPVMTPESVLPMCESAMDKLMKDLNDDLPKLIKKANAKL